MDGQIKGSDYDEYAATNLNHTPYLIEFPKEIEKIPHLLGFLDLNQLETNHTIPLEKGGLLHLLPIESLSEKERKWSEKHLSPALEAASSSKASIPVDRNISVKYNTVIGLVNHLNTYHNSHHLLSSPDQVYTQNLTSAIDKVRNDSFEFSAAFSNLPTTTIPLSATFPRTSVSQNSVLNAESIADSSTGPSTSSRPEFLTSTVSIRNSGSNGNNAVKSSRTLPIPSVVSATSYKPPLQSTIKHRDLDRKNTFSSLASFRVPMTAVSTHTTQSTPLLLKLVSSDGEEVKDTTNEKLYVHIDPIDALAAIENYIPSRWDEIQITLHDKIRPIHKFKDGWIFAHNLNTGLTGIVPSECLPSITIFEESLKTPMSGSRCSLDLTPNRMLQDGGKTKMEVNESGTGINFKSRSSKMSNAKIALSAIGIIIIVLCALGLIFGQTIPS